MRPIPVWLGDRDYFGLQDPRRQSHIRQIEANARIDARIAASAGDGSYAVLITKQETCR